MSVVLPEKLLRNHSDIINRVTIYVTASLVLTWPLLDAVLRSYNIAVSIGRFDDYGAYYFAAHRLWNGLPIYGKSGLGMAESLPVNGVFPYLYLPVVLILVLPFATLPFHVGATLWGMVGMLLLWLGLYRLFEELRGQQFALWQKLIGLWLVMGFQPVLYGFKQGQITAHLGALTCFAAIALERGHQNNSNRYVSGALTAIPAIVKPHFAPIGAHLLRNRDRLLGAVMFGVLSLVASIAIFDIQTHFTFLQIIQEGKGWGTVPRPVTKWTAGYYEPLYIFKELSLIVRAALIIAVIAVSLYGPQTHAADRAVFALGLIATPIIAPEAYTLSFILLLPAGLLLWTLVSQTWRWTLVFGFLLLHVQAYFVLVGERVGRTVVPESSRRLVLDILLPIMQPGLWGNLLLLAIAVYFTLKPPTLDDSQT